MNRIKYAEQLYALISMCLGCAFIVFGLLSFIGILQPTSTSIVQSQRNIGIVFSVLGVAFLIAQAIDKFKYQMQQRQSEQQHKPKRSLCGNALYRQFKGYGKGKCKLFRRCGA